VNFCLAPIDEALAPDILAERASRVSGQSEAHADDANARIWIRKLFPFRLMRKQKGMDGESLTGVKTVSPGYEAGSVFNQLRLEAV